MSTWPLPMTLEVQAGLWCAWLSVSALPGLSFWKWFGFKGHRDSVNWPFVKLKKKNYDVSASTDNVANRTEEQA